jgi:hypothetical protein
MDANLLPEFERLRSVVESALGDVTSLYGRPMHGGIALYPPAALEAVDAAEQQLGFPLPPLLRAVYTQLGNGGQALTLIGLDGGQQGFDFFKDRSLVSAYIWHESVVRPGLKRAGLFWEWPDRLIPIYDDLGCGMYNLLDCSTADGPVWLQNSGVWSVQYPSLEAFFQDAWPIRAARTAKES